ncbi:unnamed protein product, partial [Rotaria magnacalcarata]
MCCAIAADNMSQRVPDVALECAVYGNSKRLQNTIAVFQ